jgi:hypothetical protein
LVAPTGRRFEGRLERDEPWLRRLVVRTGTAVQASTGVQPGLDASDADGIGIKCDSSSFLRHPRAKYSRLLMMPVDEADPWQFKNFRVV